MKVLIVLLSLCTLNSFAQKSDGYEITRETKSFTVRKGDCCYEICKSNVNADCKQCLKGEGPQKACREKEIRSFTTRKEVLNNKLSCTLNDDGRTVDCEDGVTYRRDAAVNDSSIKKEAIFDRPRIIKPNKGVNE